MQYYSNTSSQQSKATPIGAVTKFGQNGRQKSRKDLGMTMMMYGHIYVTQVAICVQMNQTVKAIQEVAAYSGTSLIIACSPCEEHGYDLAYSHQQTRQLTAAGFWPLYRFDPQRSQAKKSGLILDSRVPAASLTDVLQKEQCFSQLTRQLPEQTAKLAKQAEITAQKHYALLELLANSKLIRNNITTTFSHGSGIP